MIDVEIENGEKYSDGQLIAERYWDLLINSQLYIHPFASFTRAGIKWDEDSVYDFVHYVTMDGMSRYVNACVGTVSIKHDEYEDIDSDHLVKMFKDGAKKLLTIDAKNKRKKAQQEKSKGTKS